MEGQLQRSKKLLAIRGLNVNHNPELKNIFQGRRDSGRCPTPKWVLPYQHANEPGKH